MFSGNGLQDILAILGSVALAMFIFILALFLYPVNIINIKTPIEILNKDKQVTAGERVFFRVEFDKFKPIPGTILREMTICGEMFPSKYIVHEREITSDLPVGKDQKLIMSSLVPPHSGNGNGNVRVIFSYILYGVRIKHITAESEKFIIVGRKDVQKK